MITVNETIEATLCLRFFHAMDALKSAGETNLTRFCADYELSRVKYQLLKASTTNHRKGRYVALDGCALVRICEKHGVNPEWLLLGKGTMFGK